MAKLTTVLALIAAAVVALATTASASPLEKRTWHKYSNDVSKGKYHDQAPWPPKLSSGLQVYHDDVENGKYPPSTHLQGNGEHYLPPSDQKCEWSNDYYCNKGTWSSGPREWYKCYKKKSHDYKYRCYKDTY